MDDLFVQFLSLPETGILIRSKLRSFVEAEAVKQLSGHSGSMDSLSIPSPLSPNVPRSPTSAGRRKKPKKQAQGIFIKQFYFPEGPPISPQITRRDTMTMHTLFKEHPNGLAVEEFFPVTTTFCALSSYCNSLIFSQIDSKGTGRVSQRMFWDYYTKNMQKFDPPTRLFKLLKSETGPGGQQYLTRESFTPLVEEVVRRHPGLEFLKSHPEFQARYSQTVKARIFYKVNRAANEQLTLGEFKRSNFCQVLGLLDEEDDINKIHDYFSYEHFYVIYCKFWELDEDHDFEIDNKDLMRYDDFALTTKVIDRVMEGCGRPFVSRTPGRMGYEDFVVFLMSEVDKTSDISLEYWFRCLDLDGDGVIAAYELEYFFSEQAQRLQQLSQEEVLYTDVLCQLNDMVKPKRESCFTKKDLRNTKMATQFFNIIFNLSRHVIAEQRDPILIHQVHSTPELCDWDRYAINEYIKLAESEINESEAFDQANEELDWDAKEIDVNEDMDDGNPLLD